MKTHRIFISSYWRDFPYLMAALTSHKRFCQGFEKPVVAVPHEDVPVLSVELQRRKLDAIIVQQLGTEQHNGFMRAQLSMLYADSFIPADCLYLNGSDCLFWKKVTPDDFFHNRKPFMPMARLATFAGRDRVIHWAAGTKRALGIEQEFEFMQRLPLPYPFPLFEATRKAVQKHTGVPFNRYVLNAGKNFSESNILGAYAYAKMRDLYTWGEQDVCNPPVVHLWTHGGLQWKIKRSTTYRDADGKDRCIQGRTVKTIIEDILGPFDFSIPSIQERLDKVEWSTQG